MYGALRGFPTRLTVLDKRFGTMYIKSVLLISIDAVRGVPPIPSMLCEEPGLRLNPKT
jgi:hypothetical protein